MTAWQKFSPADFDARKASRGAIRQAQHAAAAGQDGLFFVATPVAPAASAPAAPEMAGQDALWGDMADMPAGEHSLAPQVQREIRAAPVDCSGVIGAGGLVCSDADPGL